MTDTGGAAGPPAELLAAFHAYERALMVNDLDALDAAFAPGPATLRGDAAGLLVGHDAISAFRSVRGGVAPRTIERVEARMLADDAALLVSVSRYHGGGTGLQTQIWQRSGGRWLITAAHVTGRAAALDRSIWRTVGDPLYQGAFTGPLAGLTVAVKDVFAVRGYRIGAGNPTWLMQSRPERTWAPAVSDLLRGGASVQGIARTDEFAYSLAGANAHYGTPPNGALPWALPGGSSSGAAAAVATGQADVGLATDTAGSIRVPASYQGLWGLRTTHGAIPRQGVLPLAQSFDTVGWLTRDPATLEAVARWCLEGDSAGGPARATAIASRRLVVPAQTLDGVEEPTREAFEAFLTDLADAGAASGIDRVSVPRLDRFAEVLRVVQGAEAWRNNGDWVTANPEALGADVRARFATAARIGPADEHAARAELAVLRETVRALVGDALLVLPTVPGPAPARNAGPGELDRVRAATLRMTGLAGIGGLPALSAPFLRVASALGDAPVGVCFVGPAGSDLALVRWTRAVAVATAGPDPAGDPAPPTAPWR